MASSIGFLACGPDGPVRLGVSSESILGGTLDTGDPAVVQLVFSDSVCSGTVVDATHILTAAHCVMGHTSARAFICPSDGSRASSCFLSIARLTYNPRYTGDPPHDMAIATLTTPTSIAPKRIATAPLPDSAIESEVRIVGYGVTSPSDQTGLAKHQGTATLATVAQWYLTARGPSLTCEGDSGGPLLWPPGTKEEILGVLDGGDGTTCSSTTSYYARLDTDLDWIRSQGVDLSAPSVDAGVPADAAPAPQAALQDAGTKADARDEQWVGCTVWPGARGSWGWVAVLATSLLGWRRRRRSYCAKTK